MLLPCACRAADLAARAPGFVQQEVVDSAPDSRVGTAEYLPPEVVHCAGLGKTYDGKVRIAPLGNTYDGKTYDGKVRIAPLGKMYDGKTYDGKVRIVPLGKMYDGKMYDGKVRIAPLGNTYDGKVRIVPLGKMYDGKT
jgi:uncharacterized protein (DUF2147 family)